MKQSGKGPKAHTKAAAVAMAAGGQRERRSGSGVSGSPKKGGYGGKYTWAGDDSSYLHDVNAADYAVVDAGDPNFDESAIKDRQEI